MTGRSGGTAPASRRGFVRASFVLAVVVAAVALAIGSGVGRGGPATAAQRAAALDNVVKCPSCDDVSVAQSTAASALAVRREILALARRGVSDRSIESRLVSQYGQGILLAPPASGVLGLVWFVPLVAGLAAVAAVTAVLWRRGRAFARLRRTA